MLPKTLHNVFASAFVFNGLQNKGPIPAQKLVKGNYGILLDKTKYSKGFCKTTSIIVSLAGRPLFSFLHWVGENPTQCKKGKKRSGLRDYIVVAMCV